MTTDFIWSALFRIIIFALSCASSYLIAHLFHFPKGVGWVLIIFCGVISIKLPVPLMAAAPPTTDPTEKLNMHSKDHEFIYRFCKRHNSSPEEIKQIIDEYNTPFWNGDLGLTKATCRKMAKLQEAANFSDAGLRTKQGPSAELCLIGTAATIYREIFEPLLNSDNVLLQSIGLLATEVVAWLVSHGDVQSVVSKFDMSTSGKSDEKYEALKKISLFDHSFNTCLRAFELGHKGYPSMRPTGAYLAAAAGLLHDIGKHPYFYPKIEGKTQYKSSEHPLYGVDAISYFTKRAKIDPSLLTPITDAVAKHHQDVVWDKTISGVPPLPWILQQADYAARRDETTSMQKFKKGLKVLEQKDDQDFIIVDETGLEEKLRVQKPSRPLNLSKSVAVPPPLRDRKVIERFLTDVLGECINRYVSSVSNLDLETETPTYACFTHGNDLMIRMSLMEQAWEKLAIEMGVELREAGEKFPMQAAIKGLLQYLDHIEPGLVQRPLLPPGFAFIMIQVQQGWDRWTKTANYIPLSLPTYLKITGIDMRELEQRKIEEDDLAGRDFLCRICGWKKY
jgi:hypothetical protein